MCHDQNRSKIPSIKIVLSIIFLYRYLYLLFIFFGNSAYFIFLKPANLIFGNSYQNKTYDRLNNSIIADPL